MRFVGVDIASETHVVAAVDVDGQVLLKPTPFDEERRGYEKLWGLLGQADDVLVTMEATGHYWRNLFIELAARGFAVALINPLRTNRFAQEELQRTKTDSIDALGIARFAAQKRPTPTRLPDEATEELREMVHLRDRLVQDLGDRVRQLHRQVDLGFPEFTRVVRDLQTERATSILHTYPTARAFDGVSVRKLSAMRYDGHHRVGDELASALIELARTSVGQHHGEPYRMQVRYFCEDIDVLRRRLRTLERDIETKLKDHEVGSLLTTIDGIGPQTAARLVAELGDPAEFRDARALAAYVAVIPAVRQSGKRAGRRAGLSSMGNIPLRSKLWMPTLSAIRRNPWLRAYYERLIARGKLRKVAVIAAMHKLLGAVYSVAKNRRPFVPILPASNPA